MPLKETIDIAFNLLFEYNAGLNITNAEFKKKVQFATSDTYFLFQGTFYDQLDGVAMVSPPGRNLWNFVAEYIMRMWNFVGTICWLYYISF